MILIAKRLFLCVLLASIFCNVAISQSSLPECEGNDSNIAKYSRKHFNKMRKWTNCHGTAMGPDDQKYIGEFYKGEFHGQGIFRHEGREYVGQYKDHKDTEKEPIRTPMEICTLESGKSINIMEKALTYTLMEISILESGKKINILPQIT